MNMPVPTTETLVNRAVASAGSVLYLSLLVLCLLYLLYCLIIELRDWVRIKLIQKYLKEDKPVEYILDYPGYAIGEYCPYNDDIKYSDK